VTNKPYDAKALGDSYTASTKGTDRVNALMTTMGKKKLPKGTVKFDHREPKTGKVKK